MPSQFNLIHCSYAHNMQVCSFFYTSTGKPTNCAVLQMPNLSAVWFSRTPLEVSWLSNIQNLISQVNKNCVVLAEKLSWTWSHIFTQTMVSHQQTRIKLLDGTGCACQPWNHCRLLWRATIESQMKHVKVASGGKDGRRLARPLPPGSLLMAPLVFKCGFSPKKHNEHSSGRNPLKAFWHKFMFCM